MNVLKKRRDVHSNLERWHDILDITLQLVFEIWGDETQHWRGAAGIDVCLDFFNHCCGRSICEPELGTLAGDRSRSIVGSEKGLGFLERHVLVVVDVDHQVQAGVHQPSVRWAASMDVSALTQDAVGAMAQTQDPLSKAGGHGT